MMMVMMIVIVVMMFVIMDCHDDVDFDDDYDVHDY